MRPELKELARNDLLAVAITRPKQRLEIRRHRDRPISRLPELHLETRFDAEVIEVRDLTIFAQVEGDVIRVLSRAEMAVADEEADEPQERTRRQIEAAEGKSLRLRAGP